MLPAFVVVALTSTGALTLSWAYFRRYEPRRPPVGVINRRDVAVLLATVVVVPYLYLALPLPAVAACLALAFGSTLVLTLQPVLGRAAGTAVAGMLVAADVAVAAATSVGSPAFLALNNVVLVLVVVGTTNMWAQSGMKARDAAALALGLAVYDVVATWHLSLMGDLLERLSQAPLVPVVAWGARNEGLGVGLGDLLLAAVFPLVARKAFSRRSGLAALAVATTAVTSVLAVVAFGGVDTAVPAMVVLGPLQALQHARWRRGRAVERTTSEYLRADPPVRRPIEALATTERR